MEKNQRTLAQPTYGMLLINLDVLSEAIAAAAIRLDGNVTAHLGMGPNMGMV